MGRYSSPAIVAMALLFGAPPFARAGEIYRYVEADGTIVYTNVVPKSMRGVKSSRKAEGQFKRAPAPSDPAAVTARTDRSLASYDQLIERAALRYRIPVNLVRAVMHAESAFDQNAVSQTGASGLMQLMPATARDMFVSDIFDAEANIEGGVRYLRFLANEFDGDMVKMLAAYNAGPEAVRRYDGAIPPFAETQAYVRKVVKLYLEYKANEGARSDARGPHP
jgi:soluble lytic murein transglycosylase-like protein